MNAESETIDPNPEPSLPDEGQGFITVRGCRVHNLKNIDLEIPRDALVVITGISGSGKSSLAFDTIYAEGQRQYIESLSAYARQFVHQMERPQVDLIEGLEPTIAIDQRGGSHNPRSTVATVTEIYDYLRLLMARVGSPYCYECGASIEQRTAEQVVDDLLSLPEGTKAMLLAPLVRGRKGQHQEVFEQIRKAGFVRVRVDGEVWDIDQVPELAPQKPHQIEAVVDRIMVRQGARARVAESVQLALKHAEGVILASYLDQQGNWQDRLFSTFYACPNCRISYEELEPRTFSFNSPYGACPECEGLGYFEQFDPELVLPDEQLSLDAGAVVPWQRLRAAALKKLRAQIDQLRSDHDLWTTPVSDLHSKTQAKLIRGDGTVPGVLGLLEEEWEKTTSDARRDVLAGFRGQVVCAACGGARLRPEALAVRVCGRAIHEITRLSILDAAAFFKNLSFPPAQEPIAEPLVREIRARLNFLIEVGVDYLSLDRPARTLSGGESQRVRLANGIGSGLVGICYVLDEPTIGLHPRDNKRLIAALRKLQQAGNTVLVVEHDEDLMHEADYIFDLGPGAGVHGGHIMAQGTPEQIAQSPDSLTGQYLAGALTMPQRAERRPMQATRTITLEGATTNNLKNVNIEIPLGLFVCVTGVSGSGKSSLINETLAPAVARRLTRSGPKPGPHTSLRGVGRIDKLIPVDQSAIGRTPRSNPATYTGVFDEVRKVFTSTRESKQRGYKSGRFSFNVKGGRCEQCQGQGVERIEMNFLPDLFVECPSCHGARFNQQTLEVKYRGLSIADVLALNVDDALVFFENFPAISRLLGGMARVGLGYLTLGQPSTTLSGGEAQRVKLATELARVSTGDTLYILDEPTTGLHFEDIRKLLIVLDELVESGNTVLVIEHSTDVMRHADWLIDLGPEGGERGGQVVAVGMPEQFAMLEQNHTAAALRR